MFRQTNKQPTSNFWGLNRLLYRGLTLAGFLALFMAVRKPWFSVPIAPPKGATAVGEIVDSVPGCTVWFQAIIAMGALWFAASWLMNRQWTIISTLIASFLCLIPLSYPYFVMVRSPENSADAAWLQAQHDNLTWLGGDIYANAEYANMGWKSKTYLIDIPKQLSVIDLPSWSPWEIGVHRCEDLMQWLGYSNAFCQYMGQGWAMAIVGGVFLFLASLQSQGKLIFHRAGVALLLFSTVTVLAAIESDFATLQRAIALEKGARYDQAFSLIEPLVESEIAAVRREALRGIMRFAIQDYNCARFELSRERFELVLRHQPCNVKVCSTLMATCLYVRQCSRRMVMFEV